MDSKLIYEKTPAGEEAMRQRTRVVQRNLRMVLILVDGKTPVAELCEKTGNPLMTECALGELEQGGFIVPLSAEAASRLKESRKGAQEAKEADVEHFTHFSEFSTFGDKHGGESSQPTNSPPSSIPPRTAFVPGQLPAIEGLSVAPDEMLDKADLRAVQGEKEGLGGTLGKSVRAILQPGTGGAGGRERIEPIRRGPRPTPTAWSLKLLYAVVLGAALLVVVALFFPYQRYLPEVQASLARTLGQPVSVRAMRVGFHPVPGLFLDDVRIGSAGGAPIEIGELRLQPVLATLLSEQIVFHRIDASRVRLPAEALHGLSRMFVRQEGGNALTGLRQLLLEDLTLSLHGIHLGELSGEIVLGPQESFQGLFLQSAERNLRIEAKPGTGGIRFDIQGSGIRILPSPAPQLDALQLTGGLVDSVLDAENVEVRLLDGVLRGRAQMSAGQTEARPHSESGTGAIALAGTFEYERIGLKRLGEALALGWQAEGELAGSLEFSTKAEAWQGLLRALQGRGDFVARRGTLGGLDLAEAVRLAGSGPARGGETRFEQLSGTLRVTPDAVRLGGLSLGSGLMHATGTLAFGRGAEAERPLGGTLEVQMRGSVNQLRMPVMVGGTLRAPEVLAGRR